MFTTVLVTVGVFTAILYFSGVFDNNKKSSAEIRFDLEIECKERGGTDCDF